MSEEEISQELIREWFDYDPESGVLKWRKQRKGAWAGKRAGRVRPDGYLSVIFFNKSRMVHRLIWLHEYGCLPDGEVDHINGIRDDNRKGNLRVVSRGENARNTAKHRAGKLVGAYYQPRNGKWHATLWWQKKHVDLGYYDTQMEAHMAWRRAREERGMSP